MEPVIARLSGEVEKCSHSVTYDSKTRIAKCVIGYTNITVHETLTRYNCTRNIFLDGQCDSTILYSQHDEMVLNVRG